MMWFDYTTTAGVLIHYTGFDGSEHDYKANYILPQEVVRLVASIADSNNISEITCAGIAYDLKDAVKQELARTYKNTNVVFNKAE